MSVSRLKVRFCKQMRSTIKVMTPMALLNDFKSAAAHGVECTKATACGNSVTMRRSFAIAKLPYAVVANVDFTPWAAASLDSFNKAIGVVTLTAESTWEELEWKFEWGRKTWPHHSESQLRAWACAPFIMRSRCSVQVRVE